MRTLQVTSGWGSAGEVSKELFKTFADAFQGESARVQPAGSPLCPTRLTARLKSVVKGPCRNRYVGYCLGAF